MPVTARSVSTRSSTESAPSPDAARPMRRFGPADAPRILAHLLALDADDRLLRFSYAIRDEGIDAYVTKLDFARDHVHGLCSTHGDIVALAHVAEHQGEVDFGLSVAPCYRRRGLGRALFCHVIALARLRDAARVVCHSVSPAVLHMATSSGFRRPGGCLVAPLTLELRAEPRPRDDARPCTPVSTGSPAAA